VLIRFDRQLIALFASQVLDSPNEPTTATRNCYGRDIGVSGVLQRAAGTQFG
jgi:hypothetical protein